MRVLDANQMAAVDRRAIDEIGIPGPVLMEHAAIGATEALSEHFPRAEHVAIFCGPGNNGGDGYAMARLLDARGYTVDIFQVGKRPAGDALLQLEILRRSGRQPSKVDDEASREEALRRASRADVIVDALFGTGLRRPLTGSFAQLVESLGTLRRPVLAVDLPSGLDAGVSRPIGPFLRADLTVTFAAPKVAHVLAPSCDEMGEVVIADLGIPQDLIAEAPGSWHLLRSESMAAHLLEVPAGAHKGTFGHTLIIGGAAGTSGAVILAAKAAIRAGAGLVSVAAPSALRDVIEAASLESMTLAIGGEICLQASDVRCVLDAAEGKQSAVLGPGLLGSDTTAEAARHLAREMPIPLVLDADGLNAIGTDLELLQRRSGPAILTPHPGEIARLLGTDTAGVERDRPRAALALAERSGQVAVLKGRQTLIASPHGELWINTTGNPGMATGGSGDVLSGVLGALLAQGYDADAAARLGVYLHGLAGDLAAASKSRAGLAAGDLVAALPAAWRELESDAS